MFTSTDSSHLSLAKMVLSTQGQKDKKLSRSNSVWVLLSQRWRKTYFYARDTRYCVTKTQDYRIKNHVGANI